jgi:hypothetical protein
LSSPRTRHLRISLGANESRSPVDGERLFQQPARSCFCIVGFGLPPVKITIVTDLNLPNGQYTV